jgi:hypothetical protein
VLYLRVVQPGGEFAVLLDRRGRHVAAEHELVAASTGADGRLDQRRRRDAREHEITTHGHHLESANA